MDKNKEVYHAKANVETALTLLDNNEYIPDGALQKIIEGLHKQTYTLLARDGLVLISRYPEPRKTKIAGFIDNHLKVEDPEK